MRLAGKVQNRISANLTASLTIEQLASELHASPSAIKAAFRNVYGDSIYAYRKTLRLQEAQRLLSETDIPIAQVAAEIGYANPGKFAAAFKKKYGQLPREYKTSVRMEH